MDDILVISENSEQHLEQLEELLKNIIENGMTLSIDKTEMFVILVKHLGHIVSEKYISKNIDKKSFFQKIEQVNYKEGKLILKSKRSV